MNVESSTAVSREEQWPADGLEELGRCPICASPKREIMYSGLRDIVFGTAPGKWTLHRCLDCKCAYLDPRPTPETISLAYNNYFTHQGTGRENTETLTLSQRCTRMLANGFRNHYYGTNESPAHWLGVIAGQWFPPFRRQIQRSFRCLEPGDQGKRVLDVGFGGCNFLYWARAMGCQVSGTDPDPVSVSNARAMGFDVREGGIETFGDEHEEFDIITFGHVIEHLHDPASVLHIAEKILRPGGKLWLETPNIESQYHNKHKYLWRGLDVPRHLILFDRHSMHFLLNRVDLHARTEYFDICAETLGTSEKIEELSFRAKKINSQIVVNESQLNRFPLSPSDVLQVLATKSQ